MYAVILAAGIGRRLRPLTNSIPKAMIELRENVRVLDVMCCNLLSAGIKNLIIVVGHASDTLIKHVSRSPLYAGFSSIRFVENKEYASTNTAVSLLLGLRSLDAYEDVIVVNGDIVFDYGILRKLVSVPRTSIVVDNVKELTEESFKVLIRNGVIVDMGKDIDIGSASGEYIGLAKICGKDLGLAVRILEDIVGRDRNAYYDFVFRELSRIVEVGFVFTDGLLWTEIDFPEDLEHARKIIDAISLGRLCVFKF